MTLKIGMEIGTVGAGAATVGLLDTLARANAAPGGITVFDGSPAPWRGRAYQPDIPAARVNAPPMIMSIRAGDPGHYSRWLHDRGERELIDLAAYQDPGLGQPLVPRAVYGEYLGHTARAAINRLRQDGWRVSVVNSRVTGFSRDAAVLYTEHGGRHRVDRAVLSWAAVVRTITTASTARRASCSSRTRSRARSPESPRARTSPSSAAG